MKALFVVFVVLLLWAVLYLFFFGADDLLTGETTTTPTEEELAEAGYTVFTEIRGDSWLASTPGNNVVVDQVPAEVTVKFQQPIAASSTLSVKRGDTVVDDGVSAVSQDSLSLYVRLKTDQGTGPYLVTYKACPVNAECSTGRFGFNVR